MPHPRELVKRKKRQDESPIPGGCTIRGGWADIENGVHYGGVIQDAKGEVLDSFEEDEVNPGIPRPREKSPDEITIEQAREIVERSRSEVQAAQAALQQRDGDVESLKRERDELAERVRRAEAEKAEIDRQKEEDRRMAEVAAGDAAQGQAGQPASAAAKPKK